MELQFGGFSHGCWQLELDVTRESLADVQESLQRQRLCLVRGPTRTERREQPLDSLCREAIMRYSNPPGPRGYLDIVHLTYRHYLAMRWDPVRFFSRLGRRYGDLCRFTMFGYSCYLVNHPRWIREVMIHHAADVEKFSRVTDVLRQGLGESVLTTEAESWREQRRKLQQVFRRSQLQRMAELTLQEIEWRADRFRTSRPLRIERVMNELLQSTMARFLFGSDLPDGQAVSRCVREYSDRFYLESKALARWPEWIPTRAQRRKRQCLAFVRAEIQALAAQRAASRADRDVLGELCATAAGASDEHPGERNHALDQLLTLFVAGSHTSSVAAAWTWYLVARHPEVQQRLRREVETVTGGRPLRADDVEALEYAKMVVQESLRLYPPAWELFARRVKRPLHLAGYEIPPGSLILILPIVTHRDERFFPDPLRFDPERFAPERASQIDSCAYFPFGVGPHICLGKTMTLEQLPLVLGALLQRFEITLADERPVATLPRVSLRPRDDIALIFSERRSAPNRRTDVALQYHG